MKVKDLIAQLQQLNPELEIVGHESDMERSTESVKEEAAK